VIDYIVDMFLLLLVADLSLHKPLEYLFVNRVDLQAVADSFFLALIHKHIQFVSEIVVHYFQLKHSRPLFVAVSIRILLGLEVVADFLLIFC
jgi:hypothetical protein